MSAKTLVAFRSNIQKKKLEELALKKLHYPTVSEFINEAVKEKITRETVNTNDPQMTRMIAKLTEVIYEHKGWKFMKVSPEMAREIDKKADPVISGKVKGVRWMGSMDKTSAAQNKKNHK